MIYDQGLEVRPKESFYKSRKNLANKKLKIQPSLSPERKKLLEQARGDLEAYHGDEESYANPPHFILPDQHGNLLLKFQHKTKDGLFLRFNTLQELHGLIIKHNPYPAADAAYAVEISKIENGEPQRQSNNVVSTPQEVESGIGSK